MRLNSPREWDARAYDAGPQPQERWGERVLGRLDLETVVLGWHLQRLDPSEHRSFVRSVAARLPDGEIDYVRLDVAARKA